MEALPRGRIVVRVVDSCCGSDAGFCRRLVVEPDCALLLWLAGYTILPCLVGYSDLPRLVAYPVFPNKPAPIRCIDILLLIEILLK